MNLERISTDKSTGLPYLDYFRVAACDYMKRDMKTPVIISLDISNFKFFNQMYGYTEGDKLVARCVYQYCHRNTDCVLATRIYVDHIIMLVEAGNMDALLLKEKYDSFNHRFAEEINQEFPLARIRMYMGMYMIEDLDEEVEVMIDKAQYARRSIKTNYSVTVATYSENMRVRAESDASVIPMFFSALENNRIQVYIQPKFSIKEQKLIGGEALSRILDKDGKVVPPSDYIDTLENSGLIARLDNYIIRSVIDLQKEWMEEGRNITTISMNLSKMDFWENGFIQSIHEAIVKSKVPPKYFEFELTETIFCENFSEIIKQVDFLRQHGYKISMDDFGSGYNSLYMLGKVPIDVIKFDRGFVLNSLWEETGRRIMKNLMETFKDVSFEIICEGIESAEEEQIIYECGCDAVQGYLHDRPLPYQTFAEKYLKVS